MTVAFRLADAAASVRERPDRYETELRRAVDSLPSGLGLDGRAAAIARAVDRLAFAAVEGGIKRGGGVRLGAALAAGRFDAFLHPASVRTLFRLARAGPPDVAAQSHQPDAALDGRRFHLEDSDDEPL